MSTNVDFVNKYTTQAIANSDSMGLGDQVGGAVAGTLVATGVNMWNSLVSIPEVFGADLSGMKAGTYDILHSVNDNWANYYNEHKDGIELASLIAGSIVPGGLALKGMKLMQAGKLGMYPSIISDAAQATRRTEMVTMLENAGADSARFASFKRNILWSDFAQQVGQSAGMEVAVLATMNASPLMADYLKDPLSNFGLSMLYGSALGGAAGQIVTRGILSKELGAVSAKAFEESRKSFVPLPININAVDEMVRSIDNANNFQYIADNVESGITHSPLVRQYAKEQAEIWRGKAGKLETESIFGSGIKDLREKYGKEADTEQVLGQARDLLTKPISFGANTIDLPQFNEKMLQNLKADGTTRVKAIQQARATNQINSILGVEEQPLSEITKRLQQAAQNRMSITKPDWEDLTRMAAKNDEQIARVYYSPEFKVWASQGEISQILHAADIGVKEASTTNIARLTDDAMETVLDRTKSSAYIDKDYLDKLRTVSKFEQTKKIYIPDDDPALMQAWLAHAAANPASNKEFYLVQVAGGNARKFSQSELQKIGRKVDVEELKGYMNSTKEQYIKYLADDGAGSQEIAIRLNLPIETVEQYSMLGGKLADHGPTMKYTSVEQIPQYLANSRRALVLTTNSHKLNSIPLRNADMSAKMDLQSIAQANSEIIDTAMGASQSEFARELYNTVLSNKVIFDGIRQDITGINNYTVGSVMTGSADFALRNLGKMGSHIFTVGQQMTNARNSMAEEFVKESVSLVRSHTATTTGNQEFNRVINILSGLSGYRNIDEEGKLFQLIDPPPNAIRQIDPKTKKPIPPQPVKQYVTDTDGRSLFLSEGMQGVLRAFSGISKEQLHLKNTLNNLQGYKEITDLGLHIPSFNPENKFISYVIDREATLPNERVRILQGRDAKQLAEMEQDWKVKYEKTGGRYELVTKGNQENFNYWHQRLDPVDMDFADISKFHGGSSAQFSIPLDDNYAQTVINNYYNRFQSYGKKVQELYLSDIMGNLDDMSLMNQKFVKDQPTDQRKFGASQPKDSARAIKNILLGNSQLDQSSTWQTVNNAFANLIDYTSKNLAQPMDRFGQAVIEGKYGAKAAWAKGHGQTLDEVNYTKLSQELEGRGLRNPFENFQQYVSTQLMSADDLKVMDKTGSNQQLFAQKIKDLRTAETARRLGVAPSRAEEYINAGSSLLAATSLRILETGNAAVAALSWPIMTLPSLYRDFKGVQLADGSQVFAPFKAMTDGIRFRMSDAGKGKLAQWKREGFADSIVSEVSELNQAISVGGKGLVPRINSILNSDIVKKLAIPSTIAEQETRLWSLSVGYQAAKTAFPGISEVEADLFAKSFLARTIGNYHASQRPALFQGTLGSAIGLFQTYMLSWAQNMYRNIEEKNMLALSSQMLSQAGIFGMNSMPLYQQFSQAIGTHFSDKHFDLTTGTYRAVPEPVADFIIHGLPASLGVGLYTRGDINPRVPFVAANPLDTFAAVNVARQFYATTGHLMTTMMASQGFADKTRALLEGLSIQSMSRPLARIVEMTPQYNAETQSWEALGTITREGNRVGTSQMVWSMPGVLSRVLSSRSSTEQIKRDMMFSQSYYGTLDSDNRKRTANQFKISLRNGDLDETKFDKISAEYLRSGTASGLKSALNEAMITNAQGIDRMLSRKNDPNGPFMQMVDAAY